jgi:hypothetical protein
MLKRARTLVVDGVEYFWIFSGSRSRVRDGSASFCGHVVVQGKAEGASRRLVMFLKAKGVTNEPDMDLAETPFKGAVTPADVEKIIWEALKQGWDPMSRGHQFELLVPLDLKDYEVA